MASFRQTIMKIAYPIIRRLGKLGKNGTVLYNKDKQKALQSFYDLEITLTNGKSLSLSTFSGKKILLVNTASDCGYTGQYAELQELSIKYKNTLTIIGFPANDFKEQEKAEDDAISKFCQLNYGVTFPLSKKSIVIKDVHQNTVFEWLTNVNKNGWNNHAPDWNFSKYLVDEHGNLIAYFGPSISPLDNQITNKIASN